MTIRPGRAGDASSAATLHALCIREGFLASLGARPLTRLYRRIALHPGSFLLVAEDEGRVIGFAAASQDLRSLGRSFVRRDGLAVAVMAGPRLARSWRRLLETARYPGSGAGPAAELLALAVAEDSRGRGLGRALVGATTTELRRRGCDAVKVVAGAANRPALSLYQACGFRPVVRTEVHRGTASQVLQWP